MRGPLNTTLINGYMNHDLQLLVYQTSNLGQMSPLASVEYMYRKYDILSIHTEYTFFSYINWETFVGDVIHWCICLLYLIDK